MIRALFWKEYREQRVIGLTLALFITFAMVGYYQWRESQGQRPSPALFESIQGISVSLAFLCGLVTGAMLLAEEQEARTQPFLDALPAWRREIWFGKALFGLSAVMSQIFLIGILSTVLGPSAEGGHLVATLGPLIGVALSAYAWALFGSALCHNVLSAIGVALAGQLTTVAVGGILSAILETVLFGRMGHQDPSMAIGLISLLLLPFPLLGSFLTYAGPDFRSSSNRTAAAVPVGPARLRGTWRVMGWLIWRQGRLRFFVMAVVCILAGLSAHVDGLIVWPFVSLILGLTCGLSVFMSEQAGDSEVFLGTERLPGNRFWGYKVGIWFFLLMMLAGLFWLAPLGRAFFAEQRPENSPDAVRTWFAVKFYGINPNLMAMIETGTYAGLWLLHGFAVGQIFALVCRRTVVAGFMSLAVCVALTTIWFPSVLFGGLHLWQILGVPIILLIGSRLAYWPWIGNRLISRRPIMALIACGAIALTWIGSQLIFRVVEVPVDSHRLDVESFVKSLPTTEKDLAGRALKTAGKKLAELDQAAASRFGPESRPPNMVHMPGGAKLNMIPPGKGVPSEGSRAPGTTPRKDGTPTLDAEIASVLRNGWGDPAKDHKELGTWLNELFEETWRDSAEDVHRASSFDLGMIVDPTLPDKEISSGQALRNCQWIVNVFVTHGMHLQAQGHFQESLDHFIDALAVSRHMRYAAPILGFSYGLNSEQAAIHAINIWLQDLDKAKSMPPVQRKTLLGKALQELAHHEEACPSVLDCLHAEYVVVRNRVYEPETLYGFYGPEKSFPILRAVGEARLLAALPWEKRRLDRLLDAVFAGWMRALALDHPHLTALMQETAPGPGSNYFSDRSSYLLQAWSPAEEGDQGKQARMQLARLVDRSWLREVLNPNVAGLAISVENNLTELRRLRLRIAVRAYQCQDDKAGSDPPSFDDLVPLFLKSVPINPRTVKPFKEGDVSLFGVSSELPGGVSEAAK